MKKSYIDKKRVAYEKEIKEKRKKLIEMLSSLPTIENDKFGFNERVEIAIEHINSGHFYLLCTCLNFLKIGYVHMEKNDELAKKYGTMLDEIDDMVTRIERIKDEMDVFDEIIDRGPLRVEKKTIVITDPCYLVKERDESERPQWKDYFKASSIKDYPDYDLNTGSSEEFAKDRERYNAAYNKWDSEHPEDWCLCDYGESMEILGIKNFLTNQTHCGDWHCKVVDKDTKEKIGEFCADAGLVCVCVLDEVVAYNPDLEEWLKDNHYSATVVENFTGEVWIKVKKKNNSYCSYVEGKGNINFTSRLA